VDDCALCGRPVPGHDRHVRFGLPDPVLSTPERERAAGVWLSHADANSSVMMQVPAVGPFVRALLPVRLTGGYTVTFGVWIGVAPPDLQRAFESWWSPDYPQLRLTGRLANALPCWGLLAAPVDLAVRDPEHTPYCVASPDPALAAVLDDEWPHEEILAATDRQL
jgi:hypothetical protein